jgi:hypothetical protein
MPSPHSTALSRRATLAPAFAPLSLMVAATTWGLVWYPFRLLETAGLSGSVASLLTYAIGIVPLLFLAGAGPGRAAVSWAGCWPWP